MHATFTPLGTMEAPMTALSRSLQTFPATAGDARGSDPSGGATGRPRIYDAESRVMLFLQLTSSGGRATQL